MNKPQLKQGVKLNPNVKLKTQQADKPAPQYKPYPVKLPQYALDQKKQQLAQKMV